MQTQTLTQNANFDIALTMMGDDLCERERVNCIAAVGATAAAAHVACPAAALTIIAGVICHGAAIVYQAAAGDNCNVAAERCRTQAQH